MNKTTQGVRSDKPQEPQDNEYDRDSPQHSSAIS